MASIMHTLRTKGFKNTLKRAGMIYSRYAFGRFLKSFSVIVELLEEYDAKATFPITAITLQRNEDVIKEFKSSRIEWAMHGYIHIDHTKLSKTQIEEHLSMGKNIFKSAGFDVVGFRAPYLKINRDILKILKKYGFVYDSSYSFFVPIISKTDSVNTILNYYDPIYHWKIEDFDGIMEIPVSLPDDEILVDRLGYRGDKIGKIWVRMCDELKKMNAIPVIQLHPERGKICAEGLRKVMEWGNKNDMAFVHLKDIAIGKKEKVVAITGDVDIVRISDLRYMHTRSKR